MKTTPAVESPRVWRSLAVAIFHRIAPATGAATRAAAAPAISVRARIDRTRPGYYFTAESVIFRGGAFFTYLSSQLSISVIVWKFDSRAAYPCASLGSVT